jgi:hypothetical protein
MNAACKRRRSSETRQHFLLKFHRSLYSCCQPCRCAPYALLKECESLKEKRPFCSRNSAPSEANLPCVFDHAETRAKKPLRARSTTSSAGVSVTGLRPRLFPISVPPRSRDRHPGGGAVTIFGRHPRFPAACDPVPATPFRSSAACASWRRSWRRTGRRFGTATRATGSRHRLARPARPGFRPSFTTLVCDPRLQPRFATLVCDPGLTWRRGSSMLLPVECFARPRPRIASQALSKMVPDHTSSHACQCCCRCLAARVCLLRN